MVNNITLQRCIDNIERDNSYDDTLFCTTSRTCLACSIYNRRVFSLYGRDKRFPNFQNMPDFLREPRCPECGKSIGYSHYFTEINNQHLQRDIEFSNRPFVVDEEVLEFVQKSEEKDKELEQEEADYLWVTNNLPDIAPKSLVGFRRMKKSNSSNYQKIVKSALEKGYKISGSNIVSVNEPDVQLRENQLSKVSVDNGWYISISFGKSSSQNFDRALFLAKSAPKYEELEYNNNPVYQATYSEKPDDFLAFVKLYEMIKSWKSTTVIINGRMIDRKIVGSLNYCYGDRCRSGKPDFCFGASYMTQNPFGCHRLQISACNNPWWSFNHFNGNKYILDKNAIKNRIEQYGDNYKICPCYNEQYIYAVLNSLPNELTTKEYNKLMSGTQLNFSINLDTTTSLVNDVSTNNTIPQQSINSTANVSDISYQPYCSRKSKLITMILAIISLLGLGGLHRFYVGKTASGVVHLFTMGLFWIGTITDLLSISKGTFTDSNGLPITK